MDQAAGPADQPHQRVDPNDAPAAADQPKKRTARTKIVQETSGEDKRVTRSRSAPSKPTAAPAKKKEDALAVKKTTALKKTTKKPPAKANSKVTAKAAKKPAVKKAKASEDKKPAPKEVPAEKPAEKKAALKKAAPKKAAPKKAAPKKAAPVKRTTKRSHAEPESVTHADLSVEEEKAGPSKKAAEPVSKRQKAADVPSGTASVTRPPEPSDLFVFGSNPFGALGLGEDEAVKYRPAQV